MQGINTSDGIITQQDIDNLLDIPEEEEDIIDFPALTAAYSKQVEELQKSSDRTQGVLKNHEQWLNNLYKEMEINNIQLPPRE